MALEGGFRVRRLTPLDIARLAVGGLQSPNMAATLADLCGARPLAPPSLRLARRWLSQGAARGGAWALSSDGSVRAIVALLPRRGVRSWEVFHLCAEPIPATALAALLERAAANAASYGCERVFLRVADDSELIPAARMAGFMLCRRETLYRAASPRAPSERGILDADSRLRSRLPQDDYALFRLYCSSTPVSERRLIGMTMEQWAASSERLPGRRVERVFESGGALRGWLAVSARGGVGSLSVALHPDSAALTQEMVDAALRILGNAKAAAALAPDHYPQMGSALRRRGFRQTADFALLVEPVARSVRQTAAARGGAPV